MLEAIRPGCQLLFIFFIAFNECGVNQCLTLFFWCKVVRFILPSENQEQIKHFLNSEEGKKFNFIKDKSILAHQSGFDGFYMALLEKK